MYFLNIFLNSNFTNKHKSEPGPIEHEQGPIHRIIFFTILGEEHLWYCEGSESNHSLLCMWGLQLPV